MQPLVAAPVVAEDLLDALAIGVPRTEDGIALFSPPRNFEGGEGAYEELGVHNPDELQSGRGAWRLARSLARRPVDRVLEIGAGGGSCTLGLADDAQGASILVTDTSPAFLRIIRRKLARDRRSTGPVSYGTLAGEDLSRLPTEAFDAIIVASAVHHVSDWRAFLVQAARRLRPGGVFLMQEPFREGNLAMALALDMVLSDAWPKNGRLNVEDALKVRRFRDSMYVLADSQLEKDGEDKHTFLVDDIVSAADAAGFSSSAFYMNAHFDGLPADLSQRRIPCSISDYLYSFLKTHHHVSDAGLTRVFAYLRPLMARLDDTYRRGDGPALLGCVGLRR